MKYALLLIFALAGCSADLMTRQYQPYKGGTVKYLNQGASFVVNQRKIDAESKMKEYCSGEYEIISDSRQNENSGGMLMTGGYVAPLSNEYIYVSFKCKS